MVANCCGQFDFRGWCPWFVCRQSARYATVYSGAARNNNFDSSRSRWALRTQKKSLGFGTGRLHLFYLVLGGYSGYCIYRLE